MDMLFHAVFWLVGWYEVDAYGDGGELATLLMKRFPEAYRLTRTERGVHFRLPAYSLGRLKRCAAEGDVRFELSADGGHGLLALVRRYRLRPGIAVGAALFFALVYLSSSVLWRIEFVDGTAAGVTYDSGSVEASVGDEVLRETLVTRLGELGLRLGAFTPSLDLDSLCNRYLLEYDDLAWLSVNLLGNRASIEYRPYLATPEPTPSLPSELVAECDGQIAYFNVTSGMPVTAVNDTVVRGQTLVSGIMEYKDGRVELVEARGSVYAYVRREVECFVPREYTRRVPSGEVRTQRTLRFFSTDIKLYINKVNSDKKYDRIIDEGSVVLPSGLPLPIALMTQTLVEYRHESIVRSDEELAACAVRELNHAIVEVCDDALLLSRSDSTELTEGGCIARSELICLADIARSRVIVG